jgi:hypothetical protein
MNELALFAGAGGGILGGHLLGWRTVCAVEWEPYAAAFLPPDRMTAFSRPSRFGMTFKPLTDGLGAAVLMWCQEVSRARTSASQAKEPALTEPAAECGDTWRGSLARFDPATSSWRTAQPSLLEDLGESSVIWPRSGMTAAGRCWELPTLEHRISGTGSGLSAHSNRGGRLDRMGSAADWEKDTTPDKGAAALGSACNFSAEVAHAESRKSRQSRMAREAKCWPRRWRLRQD